MQSIGLLLVLLGLFAFGTELALTSSQPEFCHLPPHSGSCWGYIPRYFYNIKSNRCERFIYSGCRGNKNNFKTLKDCHYACVEKPGTCPKSQPEWMTICLVSCGSDWECPDKAKCCSYGCHVQCINPY